MIGAGSGSRRIVAAIIVIAMLGTSLVGLAALRTLFSTDYCDQILLQGANVPINCDSNAGLVVVGGVPMRVPEVGESATASLRGEGFVRTVRVTRDDEDRLTIRVVDVADVGSGSA
jgi:hypothetical protein